MHQVVRHQEPRGVTDRHCKYVKCQLKCKIRSAHRYVSKMSLEWLPNWMFPQEIRRRRQQCQASHTAPIPTEFVGRRRDCDFPVVGSSGSRLLSGNSWYAEELEKWIASFHRGEAALLFNSGYDANLSLMSCLPRPGDLVVCDELVHNSMRVSNLHGMCRRERASLSGRRTPYQYFRREASAALETSI